MHDAGAFHDGDESGRRVMACVDCDHAAGVKSASFWLCVSFYIYIVSEQGA